LTSKRKIQANRANARLSTGPRTSRGRVRSAQNAFRHGLSLPVQADPLLFDQIQILANQIAGPQASAHIKMLALRVADAQIDLYRVRTLRHQFLSQKLNDPHYDTRANMRKKFRLLKDLLRGKVPETEMDAVMNVVESTPQDSAKFAAILSNEDKKLLSLDRYERRALSRRRFAIRALDMAQRQRHSRSR